LEVIIVDDNSDPEQVDFTRFPGLDDPRNNFFFTKEGKGAGYARNIGLSKAIGKWLLFADADDYYNSSFSSFLDDYKDSSAELVFFKASCVHSSTLTEAVRNDQLQLNKHIDSYMSICGAMAENNLRYESSVPWGKLIKKALVETHNIRFDETQKSNDVTFSYLVGYHAKSITVDKRIIYCVTLRGDSIGYGLQTAEKKLDFIYVTGKQKKFFHDHNLSYYWNSAAKMLLSLYFSDRATYTRGKKILLDLGFTRKEIPNLLRQAAFDNFRQFFYKIIFFIPKKIQKFEMSLLESAFR
jgi:glycosyltransferase involved in cell wall biosynthesis